MNVLKQFLILMFFLVMVSCNNGPYERFVNKYLNENFSEFTDKSVFVRGRDQDHALILFIYEDLSKNKNEGPFIVYVNKDLKKVVKTSSHLMVDTTLLNKALLQKLAIQFLSYDVESLEVDTSGNVLIGLMSNDKIDLMRKTSDGKLQAFSKENWSEIKGNWYRRIE